MLLHYLRENSREKLTDISKKTNIPISTLFDMLKGLQGRVITKHTVLLNFSKLGYHVHAQVFLKVDQLVKEEIKKHLTLNPCVNSLYKTNNGWDLMVETVHKNIRDLDDFLEKLGQNFTLKEHKIHYLIDEIKKEEFKI